MSSEPVDPGAIKRMCDVMAHRGPDDAGYVFFRPRRKRFGEGAHWCEFTDAEFRHVSEYLPQFGGQFFQDEVSKSGFSVAFGHRRLAIIDLTHYGHQPMGNADRRFWTVYNGEIYNFPQLKLELEADGHVFRTRSDTEVLLHLWEQYREKGLTKLDGMFAFAMYDRVENTLTLARDRFGVKPLYYSAAAGFFLFASEIKAIFAAGPVEAALDPAAVVEYFTFQNLYRHQTLFNSVRLLQPGEFLTVFPESSDVQGAGRSYYPTFPNVDLSLRNPEDIREEVADLFARAVKRQLISDVEIGAYLSGGMDSGSIVAIAGASIPRLFTFTGGFDMTNVDGIEQGFDERKTAEKLSHLLQTEHYAVVLHAGDMPAAMERITWHMDDPRVGMCHQNWYVAKLAGKFVKVCLAGAGGDELFGGYPWRYRPLLDAPTFDEFDRACFRYWHRLLSPEEFPNLLTPEMRGYLRGPWESFRKVVAAAPEYDKALGPMDNMLQRALYFEFKTFLHGFLITEDRMSMAHSLETRVPFLDNALADLAWRLRPSLKINVEPLMNSAPNGHFGSADGKLILRQAMQKFLPKEYTQQIKQGFSPPDENWYRGPSMDYIKTVLLDKRTLERPWFDQDFVRAKLNEHFEGLRNHRLLIWSLLSFEWVQRHFVDTHRKSMWGRTWQCRV